LPDYNGQPLDINRNAGRNGNPYFNINAFSLNLPGTPGDAGRRSFIRPGEINFDLALLKTLTFSESMRLQIRLEAFNAFNHANFFGPLAVDGDISSNLFGQVVNAASPREVQVAAKFFF